MYNNQRIDENRPLDKGWFAVVKIHRLRRYISGSHVGKYELDSSLGYCAVCCQKLIIETVPTCESLIKYYESNWHKIPEGSHLCLNICELR